MKFLAEITISLKEGMLDPEAMAIRHAVGNLGFATDDLRTKKLFVIRFDAARCKGCRGEGKGKVRAAARKPCHPSL